MGKYAWASGRRPFGTKIKADVVGAEIERIKKETGGRITPGELVSASRSNKSPLHALFDWDDRVAADRWRLHQARNVLCCIVVERSVVKDGEKKMVSVRAFMNVDATDEEEQKASCYVSLDDAMSDADMSEQIVESALHELEAWRDRYTIYGFLSRAVRGVDRLLSSERKRSTKTNKPKAKSTAHQMFGVGGTKRKRAAQKK